VFKRWLELKSGRSALIIGPRRCGKTTFLKNRFSEFKYATLDDFDFYDWAQKDPKGMVADLSRQFIIDEIQRVPKLTVAVKYAVDNENALAIMTGSSSIGLLGSAADTLAGRINLDSLPTACWGEKDGPPQHDVFTETASLKTLKQGSRELESAMLYGMFPEVLMAASATEKEEILKNYRNTYFLRDILQMANLENQEGLYAIFQNLCRSLGSHLEVSNFAREAALSMPTAKKYLNTLQMSQLTFKLYGWQFGPAKRYIRAAKTYFTDNGIIQAFAAKVSQGQLLENFVISELEKRRKLGFINADQFYYYKTPAGKEIDLVFAAGGVVYAVEIKAAKAPSVKDIGSVRDFVQSSEQPARGFIFYLGENYDEIDGIRLVPVTALFTSRGSA